MDNLLGEFLKKRRGELKLSQGVAARRAGVGIKTWGSWERQEHLVRSDKWPQIAKALELQIDDLLHATFAALQLKLGLPAANPATLDRLSRDEATYEFRYEAVAKVAAKLELEVNKLDQKEWQFPVARWRTMLRQHLIAIEDQLFAIEAQAELFRDFVLNLIGKRSLRKLEGLRKGRLRITRKERPAPSRP